MALNGFDTPKSYLQPLGAFGDDSTPQGQNSQAQGDGEYQVAANYAKETGALGAPGTNLVRLTAPNGQSFTVNKAVAGNFDGFLKDLADQGYQIGSVGGYAYRPIRGRSGLSEHAYGNAIDINPGKNALGSETTDMPANIEALAAKHNLEWGGHWSRPDPMHFEFDPRGPAHNASTAIAQQQGQAQPMLAAAQQPAPQAQTAVQTNEPGYPTAQSYMQRASAGGAPAPVSPANAMDPNRPVPPPQPEQPAPSGRQVLGPYENLNDAYENKPDDASGYRLMRRPDGKFQWGQNTIDQGFGPSPHYHPNNDRLLDKYTFGAPSTNLGVIRQGLYNFGAGFNRSLARLLDLPLDAVDLATKATAAGLGQKPVFQFGNPVGSLAEKLSPPAGSGAINNLAGYAGEGLGATAPVVGAGLALARGGASALGTIGKAIAESPIGKGFQNAPLATTANESVIGAGSGATQGEAHELYKGATGRQGDLGDAVAQIAGGAVANPARVAAITALETGAAKAWSATKAAKTAASNAINGVNSGTMTAEQGRTVMDNYLRGHMADLLDTANQHVAALGTVPGAESASYITARAGAAKEALKAFAKNTATEERALWSPESGVNLQMPRNFERTQALFQELKDAHLKDTLRDPDNFPSSLEKLIMPGKPKVVDSGLVDAQGNKIYRQEAPDSASLKAVDTLGRGQDLRSRILQMAEDERKVQNRAPRRDTIGYLDKLAASLKEDMAKGEGGANQQELDAYNRAMAFSASRAEIMNQKEIRDILSGRAGDAAALERLVRQGQPGADAVQKLLSAANARYGSEGLLGAAKDVIRQKYANQVAPHGFVNPDAHNRFLQNYGGLLQRPEFEDVRTQLNNARQSEDALQDVIGFGRKGGYGTGESMAAARQDRAELYLKSPADSVLNHLEGVSNKFQASNKVVAQLQEDPTGHALNGFKHVVAQRVLDGGAKWLEQHGGIVQSIDRVDPGFREAAHNITDPSKKGGLIKSLSDWALSYAGAHFVGDPLGHHFGAGMVMAGRSAALARQLGQMTAEQLTGISAAVIADPQARAAFARTMTGAARTPSERAADIMVLHAYVPGLALANLPTDPESGKGTPGSPPGPGPSAGPNNQPWWKSLPGAAPGAGNM